MHQNILTQMILSLTDLTNLTEARRFARACRLRRVFSAGWHTRVYDACFVRFVRSVWDLITCASLLWCVCPVQFAYNLYLWFVTDVNIRYKWYHWTRGWSTCRRARIYGIPIARTLHFHQLLHVQSCLFLRLAFLNQHRAISPNRYE